MNDKSNRYALSGIRNKRATLAAEIVQLPRCNRKELLGNVGVFLAMLIGDWSLALPIVRA